MMQKKNDSQKEEEELKRRGSGKEGGDLGYWKYTEVEEDPGDQSPWFGLEMWL